MPKIDDRTIPWDQITQDEYPALRVISSAFMNQAVVVPDDEPTPPEYAFVPLVGSHEERMKQSLFMTEWNFCWEWGGYRPDRFREEAPKQLRWLEDHANLNLRLVPCDTLRSSTAALHGYGPLVALMPLHVARPLKLATHRIYSWPPGPAWLDDPIPRAKESLGKALAEHLWPILCGRSSPRDFSSSEPLVVLAHSPDFWLPYMDLMIQRHCREWGRVPEDSDEQRRVLAEGQRQLDVPGTVRRPCFGGEVWFGEEEAWEAANEMVEVADEQGRLRGIIEAVRSSRVQDDFSDRWSWVREDFERKLYAKRIKPKVRFVELDDTLPVHGPDVEAEIERSLLWQDLFAVLNPREKEIVVCLRNGSGTTDIARELGYANHSPVSKALARIRRKAERLLS